MNNKEFIRQTINNTNRTISEIRYTGEAFEQTGNAVMAAKMSEWARDLTSEVGSFESVIQTLTAINNNKQS